MGKLFKPILCGSIYIPILLQLTCSLPSDIEPVKWNMHLEIPVTTRHYTAYDLIDQNFGDEMSLQVGDTVSLFKSDSFRIETVHPLIASDTSMVNEALGSRPLQNTPQVNFFFGFLDETNSSSSSAIINSPVSFSRTDTKNIDGIRSVTIDSSSPDLNIKINNNSSGVNLTDVTISLLDKHSFVITSFDTLLISSKTNFTLPVNICGKTLHDVVSVTLKATIPAGSTINSQDGLGVSFNLDGMRVSEATLLDSKISYSDTFSGTLNLSDSFKIEIVDLENAVLSCQIENPCAFKTLISGVLDNAWDYEFSINHKLDSLEQLKNISDSSFFAGNVIYDTIFKRQSDLFHTALITLNDIRLFPSWDRDSGKSFLKYRYKVKAIPDGRWINFKKTDQIIFKLTTSAFPFMKIKGSVLNTIVENFSDSQNISFDWNEAIVDSLKKSFRFQNAMMKLSFIPDLPRQSSIDSLKLSMYLSGNSEKSDPVTLVKKICNIKSDTLYYENVNITNLLNDWSDTLLIKTKFVMPKGTGLTLHNRRNNNGHYSSSLSINVTVGCALKIPLSWQITDTIFTELDPSSFSLEADNMEWVNKIQNPEVYVYLKALNNTNVSFNLYALCASDRHKDLLMSVPDSLLYTHNPQIGGKNLFWLFGDKGLELKPRGTINNITVKFDKRATDAFLAGNECHIRWFLVIPSSNPDALTKKDFLDLTAISIIKGVGNTDSLFSD